MATLSQARRYGKLTAALVILAGACGAAEARGRYNIKSIKGEAVGGPSGWHITLSYDVRIKDYDPRVEYELVLYVTEKDRPLQNAEGQMLQQVVKLHDPLISKKGEARFTGPAEGDIPADLVRKIKDVRIKASLHVAGDARPLAEKKTGLKVPKH